MKSNERPPGGLPGTVEQWFYKHGLFLSSYPICASSVAIVVLLFCCYPLVYIPLPGTIPTKIVISSVVSSSASEASTSWAPGFTERLLNTTTTSQDQSTVPGNQTHTFDSPLPWIRQEPFVFVQQVLFRASVLPWTDELILTDAFRGPLAEIFKLVEIIRNHEVDDNGRKITLSNICLHVENVKMVSASLENLLPEYNCLVLSPANFWHHNPHHFNKDSTLLNTIFQYHNFQKTKISIAEMLLGMKLKDSGIKRYPIRARMRIIQFAVTLVLHENHDLFLKSLREKLLNSYPLSKGNLKQTNKEAVTMTYIYYPGKFNIFEILPLIVTFLVLFFYFYFFLKKMDFIRSRFVLALASIFTTLGSLIMSLGLCFFFGLTISDQLKGIIPYLVILVGLENVLVITKCILSTDETLDVKIRVAKGLSKEGWSILKTLLTEITILTIGLATFVPFIQEFCIFAIVGLISDFFLQMLFFSTVLAMDIKPYNHTVKIEQRKRYLDNLNHRVGNTKEELVTYSSTHATPTCMIRSQSHPKLNSIDSSNSTDVIATKKTKFEKKIPKRLKFVNFWARTRLFQRCFMIWMIVWISMIVYNSGVIESMFDVHVNRDQAPIASYSSHSSTAKSVDVKNARKAEGTVERTRSNDNLKLPLNYSESINRLKFKYETSDYLSNFHWSSILKQYNISLTGKFITLLPSIKLSHFVNPDIVIKIRNPDEKPARHFQWKALAAALDPIDFSDMDSPFHESDRLYASPEQLDGNRINKSTPLYPKSPMELFFAAILICISIFVLTYTLVVMYRCICTRNYAEWRASWTDTIEVNLKKEERILQNSVPILIKGHNNSIECLGSDGSLVASSCLEGRINVWDVVTGDSIAKIVRNQSELGSNKTNTNLQIWCLDFVDNLIAIGCADGRLEFWEGSTGNLKCILDNEASCRNGATHIKLIADCVVVARLCGRVDFFKLESYNHGMQIDWGFTSAYRRTHVRTGSTGSLSYFNNNINSYRGGNIGLAKISGEELKCLIQAQHQGHQQPITCMDVVRNTLFTGSQDHTLKVFKLNTQTLSFTLHGHCGSITALFIDPKDSSTGGSGSQDGLLCVWDLESGVCIYGIQAHDGAVLSLVASPSYVISMGSDERLCVWERFQGHLLNTIPILYPYSALLMLTPSLLLTSKPGSLIVWDVRTGDPMREVKLDCANSQLCPKIILPASDCIICDYGNELRIIRFPLVAEKTE